MCAYSEEPGLSLFEDVEICTDDAAFGTGNAGEEDKGTRIRVFQPPSGACYTVKKDDSIWADRPTSDGARARVQFVSPS